jgi:hypothetical protein
VATALAQSRTQAGRTSAGHRGDGDRAGQRDGVGPRVVAGGPGSGGVGEPEPVADAGDDGVGVGGRERRVEHLVEGRQPGHRLAGLEPLAGVGDGVGPLPAEHLVTLVGVVPGGEHGRDEPHHKVVVGPPRADAEVGEEQDQIVPGLRLGVPGHEDGRPDPADGGRQVGPGDRGRGAVPGPGEGLAGVVGARGEDRLHRLREAGLLVGVRPPEFDDRRLPPGEDRVGQLGERGGPVGGGVDAVGDDPAAAEHRLRRGEEEVGDGDGLGAVEVDVDQARGVGAEGDADVAAGEVPRVGGPAGPEPADRVLARLGAARGAARTPAGGGVGGVDGDGLPPGRPVAADGLGHGGHAAPPVSRVWRSAAAQQGVPSRAVSSTAHGQRTRTRAGSMPRATRSAAVR